MSIVTGRRLNYFFNELSKSFDKRIDNVFGGEGQGGDAGNLITKFTIAGSRALPVSGEKLSVTLGKIVKYLKDLKTVAFTGSYDDLDETPMYLAETFFISGKDQARTEKLLEGDALRARMWLLVGQGCTISNAAAVGNDKYGAIDFTRVFLIAPKHEKMDGDGSHAVGRSFMLLQLGSSGSTTRFTLTAKANNNTDEEYVEIKVPKGSYTEFAIYAFPRRMV